MHERRKKENAWINVKYKEVGRKREINVIYYREKTAGGNGTKGGGRSGDTDRVEKRRKWKMEDTQNLVQNR